MNTFRKYHRLSSIRIIRIGVPYGAVYTMVAAYKGSPARPVVAPYEGGASLRSFRRAQWSRPTRAVRPYALSGAYIGAPLRPLGEAAGVGVGEEAGGDEAVHIAGVGGELHIGHILRHFLSLVVGLVGQGHGVGTG